MNNIMNEKGGITIHLIDIKTIGYHKNNYAN